MNNITIVIFLVSEFMQIKALLTKHQPGLTPKMRQAAAAILLDYDQIPFASIRQLAGQAGVSTLTLIRLVRALGFAGYRDFQAAVKAEIYPAHSPSGRPDNSLFGRRPPAMNADWPADWNTDWPADWPGIAEAAWLITQARQVQVTGFRSARGFAHYMVYMARMVFDNFYLLAHPGAGNVEDLARMTDGDVIIAFSSRPYSVETVRLLRAAHQLKIKTIAITDTPSSPLVKYATVPVIVPTEKGKYLFRMGRTFSAIEAILETVFDDPAVEAHERIAYFADRMKAIRGYWEES
jgi:DNA-binding MurR/RpiR family transcriptional regulator